MLPGLWGSFGGAFEALHKVQEVADQSVGGLYRFIGRQISTEGLDVISYLGNTVDCRLYGPCSCRGCVGGRQVRGDPRSL